ncbi:MAG: divalent metal cation transporter [Planctomycetes bacterium]|nr:divalent metal cation transporter [Planctomycetota bacterium]
MPPTRVPDDTAIHGLPMVDAPDPAALEAERRWLVELEAAPAPTRWWAFLKRGGPGYLQAALTLGGGTAASSLFAGAAFGYRLLWVAPVAMLLGVIMMAAVAHQTLSTGLRPFAAMKRYAGPVFAYGWAVGALVASIVWHFAQYSLAGAVIEDIGQVAGFGLGRSAAGFLVLAWAVVVVVGFGASARWTKVFDNSLRILVYGIILCFGFVVLKTGIHDPGALLKGYFAFEIPDGEGGVSGLAVVISGLAAAVGVNMIFLYPYTLLARGWGREHRRLAKFDLGAGMFLPYLLATSLMVIATANVLHYGDSPFSGTRLSPVEAAGALAPVVGETFGRVVFDLGILGMAMSTIALHMLCAGFACSEMFGWKVGGAKYKLACLLPAPGVLGAVFWSDMAIWIAVPTTILCGALLPIAYLGFLKLQRSRAYLGGDLPRGRKAAAWFGGMVLATLTITVFLAWFAITRGPGFLEGLKG